MNPTLLKALVALIVVSALIAASAVSVRHRRNLGSVLQLLGSLFMLIVAVVHIFEALAVFPQMQWGQPDSVGHYLDLTSAVLGFVLVPLGFTLGRIRRLRGLLGV